jgi:hypothetical protein
LFTSIGAGSRVEDLQRDKEKKKKKEKRKKKKKTGS